MARERPNAETAQALLVSTETVKSHVAEILRELQLRDPIQVVVHACENRLVGRGD